MCRDGGGSNASLFVVSLRPGKRLRHAAAGFDAVVFYGGISFRFPTGALT
jgi:hypothetical protein